MKYIIVFHYYMVHPSMRPRLSLGSSPCRFISFVVVPGYNLSADIHCHELHVLFWSRIFHDRQLTSIHSFLTCFFGICKSYNPHPPPPSCWDGTVASKRMKQNFKLDWERTHIKNQTETVITSDKGQVDHGKHLLTQWRLTHVKQSVFFNSMSMTSVSI